MLFSGVAKRKDKIVIAVSQFSREVEKQNRAPVMSDLRSSGAVEQDADIILFPWPTDPMKLREGKAISILEMDLNVAENRDGSIGPVKCEFNRDRQFFYDYEDEIPEPPQINF
jgi:replicative DNA helicase